MKKYFLLFLIFFSLISCANKENEYAAILKQNNTFLSDQIEAYKVGLDIKKMDRPSYYDSIYCKTLYNIIDEIHILKSAENYQDVKEEIIKLGKIKKLNLKFGLIKSENVQVLKNNLFINVINLYNIYEARINYGCTIPNFDWFKIRKATINDSIEINIEASNNPYQVIIDSISDGKKNILNYKTDKVRTICKIKYKSNSNNYKVFGKVYSLEDGYDENAKLLQRLE